MRTILSIKTRAILCCALILMAAGACSSRGGSTGAAGAVQNYLQALAERDENRVIGLSCAAWEAQARQEFNSFSAVKLELQNVACQQTGQEGDYTLVGCTGKIIANYGAEDVEIDIAAQTYRAVNEGGEWRVCGYQQ